MSLSFGDLGYGAGPFGGFADPLPSVTVEVAFDSDPLAETPVWTDITEWVEASQPVTIRRGRASETDEMQPGQLSLTLDNTDGRFTAGLASSPYYPNVTINRRIRVTAERDSVTYPLFDGHVDKWPVGWQGGVRAMVSLTATDRTKLLARRPMMTLLDEEVLADEPLLFWPLTEPASADVAGDVARVNSRSVLRQRVGSDGEGAFSFGNDWRMLYSTAPTFDNPVPEVYETVQPQTFLEGDATPVPVSGSEIAFECWVKVDHLYPASSTDRVPFFHVSSPDWAFFTFEVYAAGSGPFGSGFNGDGQLGWKTPTEDGPRIDDRRWHHLVASRESGLWSYYLDGELAHTQAVAATFSRTPGGVIWVGGYTYGVKLNFDGSARVPFNGQVSRVAIYDHPLTAERVAAHYRAGVPSATELSSERVQRIAELTGLPVGAIETGLATVAFDQDTSGRGAHEAVFEVARSEGGLAFFDASGNLTFHSRKHRINQAASFVLDAQAEQVNADLEFEMSDVLLVNDIAVDRPRGGPVRVVDAASVATFGLYAEQVSTLLTSPEAVQAFGQWELARRATPRPRAGRVTVDPFTEPALYSIALGTELGDRGTLTNLPATAPASNVDVVVEGVEHSFSIDGWTTSWDASPADETVFMVWDEANWDEAAWA